MPLAPARRSRAGRSALSAEAHGWPARPEGALVWAHVGSAEQQRALLAIAQRLRKQRGEGVGLLLTHEAGSPLGTGLSGAGSGEILCPLAPDRQRSAQAFVDHWRPDFVLWAGGQLRPASLLLLASKGVGMMMLDGQPPIHRRRLLRWGPTRVQQALRAFSRVIVASPQVADQFTRLGLAPERIAVGPPLRSSGVLAPACDDEDVARSSQLLAGRPIWLAAQTCLAELAELFEAHRDAMRQSHRLLLVISPARIEEAEAIAAFAAQSGLRYVDWTSGDEPDEQTQVLLCDGGPDLALWYRLAPVAFLGGTLRGSSQVETPFTAAALGAALLYGPNVQGQAAACARLAAAGAAIEVRSGADLGRMVTRLMAPDRAAAMALAGWEIVSESASAVDQALEALHDALDRPRNS